MIRDHRASAYAPWLFGIRSASAAPDHGRALLTPPDQNHCAHAFLVSTSQSCALFLPSPTIVGINRRRLTASLKPSGSNELRWSGPSALRSSVRCASMVRATSAAAVQSTSAFAE